MKIRDEAFRYGVVIAASVSFWIVATLWLNTEEPWDSPDYLPWYLAAVALSAVLGWSFPRHPWRWGALFIFGQLPVILFHAGPGPLFVVGLGMLALQSIPACLLSIAGGKVRDAASRGR